MYFIPLLTQNIKTIRQIFEISPVSISLSLKRSSSGSG